MMTYDVFISFKNSDEDGHATKDSAIAKNLYEFLSGKGLRVFFSNVELEYTGKAQYSKVIDEALDSSRFLIAVGCSQANLDSHWVRYEWESFINDIRSGIKPSAEVFVLYQGMKISEMPRALRQQQAFDVEDKTSCEKLYRFIKNAMGSAAPQMATAASNPSVTVGETIPFGPYDWRVLDVQDDRALLITNNIVENRAYHHEQIDMTWADCDLRAYLNGEFYEGKFSAEEKERIVAVNNRNPDTRHLCADGKTFRVALGGRNTEDRVFLLSIPEVIKYFDMSYMSAKEFYTGSEWDSWPVIIPEKLPYSHEATVGNWWFLRSLGFLQYSLAFINEQGIVGYNACMHIDLGIRPAMWIKL